MTVALGGTFDPIHDGHRALFERAFELGDVTVGLTSDDLAPETRAEPRRVRPFEERRTALEAELRPLADAADREFAVRKLEEPTGIATEPEFEAIVVSPDTLAGAERINEIREERGWSQSELLTELRNRRRFLKYLQDNGVNDYRRFTAMVNKYYADAEEVMARIEESGITVDSGR